MDSIYLLSFDRKGRMTIIEIRDIEKFINTTTLTTSEKSPLLEKLDTMKKDYINEVHKYKITYLAKCNRWNTYVKTKDGKRKELKAPTETALYKKLWEWYGFEGKTVFDLFWEWLSYKETITTSESTIRRHEQHFRKYLTSSPLLHKNVAAISKLELQKECNRIVKDFNLSYKEWQNVKTIIGGMFAYAADSSMIPSNIMKEVKITVKYRQVVKKDSSTEVYNDAEYLAFYNYFYTKYAATEDPVYIQALLQIFTGMRVGEVVALKWDDVCGNKIHVVRQQVTEDYRDADNKWKQRCCVVDHTKTHTDRFVVLAPYAIDLLKKLDHSTEYIFTRKSTGRITSRQLCYALEKYALDAGMPVKSSHKSRKTYASRLANGGVPIDQIRIQLGHKDAHTTLSYIYDTTTDNSYSLISKAIAPIGKRL